VRQAIRRAEWQAARRCEEERRQAWRRPQRSGYMWDECKAKRGEQEEGKEMASAGEWHELPLRRRRKQAGATAMLQKPPYALSGLLRLTCVRAANARHLPVLHTVRCPNAPSRTREERQVLFVSGNARRRRRTSTRQQACWQVCVNIYAFFSESAALLRAARCWRRVEAITGGEHVAKSVAAPHV